MVKKGYKKTEVGVIPEDWEVKYLKQISPSQSVGLVINPSSYFDEKGTVPSLVGSQISENHINWEIANRITEASNESLPASRLKAGDLVTVRVGEPGITAVVPPELDGCNCASMMIVRQHPSFNSLWLCYMMNSRLGKAQINHVQYGTAQKQFNISDAIDFIYPVPPFPEQKTIAQTLSDVDALIAALDKHIAKKRNIKTGTMQQLLTGKTRLPGFGEGKGYKKTEVGVIPEDWKISHISNLTLSHKQGYYTKEKYVVNGTRLVRITDLYNPKIDYESMPMLSISDKDFEQYKIAIGDFLFARSGAIGRYGIVKDKINAIFGSYIIRFNFKTDRLLNDFFGYLFETKIIFNQLLSITQGSSNININAGNIKSLKIALPSITEQQALAQVLSDMDKEITALEKRRAKTQAIKQGMMQELLTGRTRLKIEHPDDPITKNSNG